MANIKTEQLAAERLLESGVRVPISAPLFLRFFGKREIKLTLRKPFRGTLFYCSREALKAGFDIKTLEEGNLEKVLQMIVDYTKPMSRYLAMAFLRRKWLIRLFTRPMADWLTWGTDNSKMAEIALVFVLLSTPQDFTTTIRLMWSLKLTTPKNLSPKDQGSQEDEQPDSIAPGEQPGASQKQPDGKSTT